MEYDKNQYIWAEKYRPKNVQDLIFPEAEKEKLSKWLQDGEIPNIALWGTTPGTGKTTIMNMISENLNVETLWINGSKDNGIDVMRNDIGQFVRSKSVLGKHKLICIDESDYLTPNAQATLRSDMEQYSQNVRFFFTGNYPERIIEPLMNRLQNFDLDDIYSSNKKELAIQTYKRLSAILENEGVAFDKKDLSSVITAFYPSSRNMLMFLQKHSVSGELKFDHIDKPDQVFENLIQAMKMRKFKAIKEAVQEIMIPDSFYTYVYKHLDDIFTLESQPTVILELADYQDYSQRAKNKSIPLLAFVTKLIGDTGVKFK